MSLAVATPAQAQTARDLLTAASFQDRDPGQAMRRITSAHDHATQTLRQAPADAEAGLMAAMATGYRAKLTGSRADAIAARKQFEALIAKNPRNAEAQLALGAWHMGAVYRLGRIVARAALGAQKGAGLSALDQSVALGGNRAFFSGLSALLRLELDPADPRGRALAEAAARGATPTTLDRIMQRAATAVLVPVRSGNAAATRALASRLLPMGQLPNAS